MTEQMKGQMNKQQDQKKAPAQLTLRELRSRVTTIPGQRKPSWKQAEAEEMPVATYRRAGLRIMVFPSGYITAHSGRNHTVFHISDCGAYSYRFGSELAEDATRHDFDEDYFLDLRWEIRVLMEAEDRLELNGNLYEYGRIGKHRTDGR